MSSEELNELLKIEIDNYVKKYCIKHKVSEEVARKHAMVMITEQLYKEGKLR